MDRPKFFRHCDNGVQLRVEQIGPHQWAGSIYLGQWPAELCNEATPRGWWDPVFTESSEAVAKDGAIATVQKKFGPHFGCDSVWLDCSDSTEEDWARQLRELGFPGYPERKGMERWEGF